MKRAPQFIALCTLAVMLSGCQTTAIRNQAASIAKSVKQTIERFNFAASTLDTFDGRFIDGADIKPPNVNMASASSSEQPLGLVEASTDPTGGIKSLDDTLFNDKGVQTHNEGAPPANPVPEDGITMMRVYSKGILSVPKLEDYANGVLGRLIDPWSDGTGAVKVYISPSPGYDGRSFPDGTIIVDWGFIMNLQSEDELAALLAHEASHVLLGHHDRETYRKIGRRAYGAIALAADMMFTASQTSVNGQKMRSSEKLKQNALQIAMANRIANLLSSDVLDPGWSRRLEDEADFMAIDLMIAADYNANAYLVMLERLQDYQQKTKQRLVFDNQKYEQLAQNQIKNSNVGGALSTGFAALLDKGFVALNNALADLKQEHNSPAIRIESVKKYLNREYRLRNRKRFAKSSLFKAINAASSKYVLQSVEHANQVGVVMQDDPHRALKLAKQAMKGVGKDIPATHFAMYLIRDAMGDQDRALSSLVSAIENAQPEGVTLSMYKNAFRLYVSQKNLTGAGNMVDRATKDFGDIDLILPERIQLAVMLGKNLEVVGLMSRCRLSGDNELYQRCGKAQKGQAI